MPTFQMRLFVQSNPSNTPGHVMMAYRDCTLNPCKCGGAHLELTEVGGPCEVLTTEAEAEVARQQEAHFIQIYPEVQVYKAMHLAESGDWEAYKVLRQTLVDAGLIEADNHFGVTAQTSSRSGNADQAPDVRADDGSVAMSTEVPEGYEDVDTFLRGMFGADTEIVYARLPN